MEYDTEALELVKRCAGARLSEAERAVLTLLLLLEGGWCESEVCRSKEFVGKYGTSPNCRLLKPRLAPVPNVVLYCRAENLAETIKLARPRDEHWHEKVRS